MIQDTNMNNMFNDIVEIFTKIEGVQLVRLTGLQARCSRISNMNIDKDILITILNKMKMQNIINWQYVYQCPHCHEIIYQIENIPDDKLRICDTCQNFIIPKDHLYQFQHLF